jgi:hypothetical protein
MSELLSAKVLLATDGAEGADLAARAAAEVAEGPAPSCTWPTSSRCPIS